MAWSYELHCLLHYVDGTCMCVAYLKKRLHQDVLWEEDQLTEAVLCSWEMLGLGIHVNII